MLSYFLEDRQFPIVSCNKGVTLNRYDP